MRFMDVLFEFCEHWNSIERYTNHLPEGSFSRIDRHCDKERILEERDDSECFC